MRNETEAIRKRGKGRSLAIFIVATTVALVTATPAYSAPAAEGSSSTVGSMQVTEMPENDAFSTVDATEQELGEIAMSIDGEPTTRYVGLLESGQGAVVDIYAEDDTTVRVETYLVAPLGVQHQSTVEVERIERSGARAPEAMVTIIDRQTSEQWVETAAAAAGGPCADNVANGACLLIQVAEVACALAGPETGGAACGGVAVAGVGCLTFQAVCFFVDVLPGDPDRGIPKDVLQSGGYHLDGQCMVSTSNCTIAAYAVLTPGDSPDSSLAAFWHTEPFVYSWTIHSLPWSVVGTTGPYVIYQTGTRTIHGAPLPFASCATWVDMWLGDIKKTFTKQSSMDACADYYGWDSI